MSMKAKLQQFLDQSKMDMTVVSEVSNAPYFQLGIQLGPKATIKKLSQRLEEVGMALNCNTPFMRKGNGKVFLDIMSGPHPVQNIENMLNQVSFSQYRDQQNMKLPILLGTTEVTNPLVVDLAQMPHLLIAGTTGSGKSTCVHGIIQSLALQADKVGIDFVLIDPKRVEFSGYEDLDAIKSNQDGIVCDVKGAVAALKEEVDNMENRLRRFEERNCRNIEEWRRMGGHVNYTVIVIDELASLMDDKQFERYLGILGAKGRAAGYCLIACTQYPHSKVVSSTITTHFDGRIAFRMQNQAQSNVVLQEPGAENLQGKGDGLFTYAGQPLVRFHGVFCNSSSALVSQLSTVPSPPSSSEKLMDKAKGFFDTLFNK